MQITTIGLDLAKSVFQIHGVDATGQVAVRKSLRRSQMLPFFAKLPPCLVHVRNVPCVDGSGLARAFFTFCSIGRCSHVFGLLMRFT